MTLGKMAGEGIIPRDDFGALREDPLAVTLVDDEDILELIILKNYEKTTDEVGCLNTLMNSLNEVISVHSCAKKQSVN